jgi:hypothetical protein
MQIDEVLFHRDVLVSLREKLTEFTKPESNAVKDQRIVAYDCALARAIQKLDSLRECWDIG